MIGADAHAAKSRAKKKTKPPPTVSAPAAPKSPEPAPPIVAVPAAPPASAPSTLQPQRSPTARTRLVEAAFADSYFEEARAGAQALLADKVLADPKDTEHVRMLLGQACFYLGNAAEARVHALTCTADGKGCVYWSAGESCGAASCADGCATGAPACDGGGLCVAPMAERCPGSYACADPTSCATTCTNDTGCSGGLLCRGGQCLGSLKIAR